MSKGGDPGSSSIPPAKGERYARWGYGYQDKAATEMIFRAVRDEMRSGGARLEGVRLADERAGRVDDCILVWETRIQGNSIKWRNDAKPMAWAGLVGANGLLKELAEGYQALKQTWTGRRVQVCLHTSYPASESVRGRLVRGLSVADFVEEHWGRGPQVSVDGLVRAAWNEVESHTGLRGPELEEFVRACELSLGVPEPCIETADDEESRAYRRQFNRVHRALATWLTMRPGSEMVEREYLLDAVALGPERGQLVQTFPPPSIPYRRNAQAAVELRNILDGVEGGYVAVSGNAGGGKSTLVQDVLGADQSIVLVPYFAFLPEGEGPARERGEALPFYNSVVGQLDRAFSARRSLGIENVQHGREALRTHMSSAHEQFIMNGVKTVLLVDGLDHVNREPDLADSILRELPGEDEIPSGFVIVLSSRPEALLADAVGPDVSGAVAEASRRVSVDGLSREAVHEIALAAVPGSTAEERDRVYFECGGNPLILTYRLNAVRRAGNGAEAVSTSDFDGDIEAFYRRALAVPLQNPDMRRLLGLLCRASPAINSRWLQEWPERGAVEQLYERVLAPFMREEDGELRFIHSSLTSFLIGETGPKLPGADGDAMEVAYHSDLADRTAGRPCRDSLGRAHIFHLTRAGRLSEALEVATSGWFRQAVRAFVPYALVRPVVLEALRVAWELAEYGDVVRLVLVDAELAQRSGQLGAGELAEALLKVGDHELALAQVRAQGRLLVDDDVTLEFARKLWFYGEARSSSGLRERARRLYAEAKPIGHLLRVARRKFGFDDHETRHVLEEWCATSPLFEPVDEVVDGVVSLDIEVTPGVREERSAAAAKAAVLGRSLRTAVRAKRGADFERQMLGAIGALQEPEWELAALLVLCGQGETNVSAQALIQTWERCGNNWHLALEVAEQLFAMGEEDASKAIMIELDQADVTGYEKSELGAGRVDVPLVLSLTRLRELLGLADTDEVHVENDRDEGIARVVVAARRLGILQAAARREVVPSSLREDFRSVLFYASRQVVRPDYGRRPDDVVPMSKRVLVGELIATARGLGSSGMRALRDVVRDASSGTFLGWHRRQFALAFRRADVLTRDEALALGLSWTGDAEDEDPRVRQEACLEIAGFVRRVGSDGWSEWVDRAGRAAAGSGSHKDDRMAHLAVWLDEAIGSRPPSAREAAVLGKFLRALEVSGGAGGYEAAEQVLRTVLRVTPDWAAPLAVEMIDRNVAGLQGVLEALVVSGSATGASPELLAAVFEELLSLVALDGPGEAAGAVVNAFDDEACVLVARRLMRCIRTNSLPSTRLRLARDMQQALGRRGFGDEDLGEGLPDAGGEGDDRSLYRLADGRCLTSAQIGARLASAKAETVWNPNPDRNEGYDWRPAMRFAGAMDADRLDAVLARRGAVDDYREAEILAARSVALHARDELAGARELAEKAVAASQEWGWFVRGDGAQRRAAYRALGALDAEAAVKRSRAHFGRDLAKGELGDYFVISELPALFRFLEIAWPKEAVLDIIDEFVDEVLAASPSADGYQSLSGGSDGVDSDQAIATFLVGLLGLPAGDVSAAARRALSSYLARCPCRFVGSLVKGVSSDMELEHLLIAIDVACRQSPATLSGALRPVVQGLNEHESLAVRGIARRICGRAGWAWAEVRDRRPTPRVRVRTQVGRVSWEDSGMLVGGDVVAVWGLFKGGLRVLETAGIADVELESEFAIQYSRVASSHRWQERQLEERWRQSSFASAWQRPRAAIGRAAAMRVLGRYALEGRGPDGAEEAYDHLFPLYDPVLDWRMPVERPVELRALEWGLMDDRQKAWAEGENAGAWSQYPDYLGDLRVLGEVSYLVRPDRQNCCETRIRGVLDQDAGERLRLNVDDHEVLLSAGLDLTHEDYVGGRAAEAHQIVARNGQGMLAGAVYRWVALSTGLANRVGWRPSSTDPFGWLGPDGEPMVTSVYWRDGRTSVMPPRWDSLGEGWCLLATEDAVRAIREAVDGATVHLVVRRQRFGAERSDERWHLHRAL